MTRFQLFSAAPTSQDNSVLLVFLFPIIFELWVCRSGKSTFTYDHSESLQSRSSLTDSRYLRIHVAFYYAFRSLVPLPHDRTPWSWSNAYWAALPFIPLIFMAYLARRRDTFTIRLLLLPTSIFLAVRTAYGCVFPSISGTLRLTVYCGGSQILLAPTMASDIQLDTKSVIRLYYVACDKQLTAYV